MHIRYLATVRPLEKQFDLAEREYGGPPSSSCHPPPARFPAPFYLSRPAQASDFLMLNSTWRDVPTRARLSEMQIAASGAVYDGVAVSGSAT